MLLAVVDRAGMAAVVNEAIRREGGLRPTATAVGVPHSVLSLWRRQKRGRASRDYLGSFFEWAWKNAPDLGGRLRDVLFDSAGMQVEKEYRLWLARTVGSPYARRRRRCVDLREALGQVDRSLAAMFNRFENDMRRQGILPELEGITPDAQRLELSYQRVLGPLLDADDSGGAEIGWSEALALRVPGGKRSALHVILELGLKREIALAQARPSSTARSLRRPR